MKSKLKQRLIEKGVPESAADTRAQSVLSLLSEDQVISIYKNIDPWSALKAAIGNRLRLVTQEDMKDRKNLGRNSSRATSSTDVDPWTLSDPWLEAKAASRPAPSAITVKLLPGQFTCQDGSEAPAIANIQSQACGVCLIAPEQLSTFSSMSTAIPSSECAGLVVGEEDVAAGPFPTATAKASFVAEHDTAGKILLKGTLVNFGSLAIVQKKVEICKQYCNEWSQAQQNPMRFIWKNFDNLTRSSPSSWQHGPEGSSTARRWLTPEMPLAFAALDVCLFLISRRSLHVQVMRGSSLPPRGPTGVLMAP